MEGNGKYKLPSGSIYNGTMKDGMYHGLGKVTNINGEEFTGTFSNGYPTNVRFFNYHMFEGSLTFPDGLEYFDKKWSYCDGHDRRFESEIESDLKAVGKVTLFVAQYRQQYFLHLYLCFIFIYFISVS